MISVCLLHQPCHMFGILCKLVVMLAPIFLPFPELYTSRLLLRQMLLSDAPSLQQLRSNVEVMRYINRPLTKTLDEAVGWINVTLEALKNNTGITWCICLKETPSEHIGSIGLWRFEKENYRAEIGYMLEPALQGQGIMYEALVKVLEYGFKVLSLHSVEAHIDPRNVASAALLRKAGFIQEGYFRENCYYNGQFTDTAVYSILTPYKDATERKKVVHDRNDEYSSKP